MVFKYLLCQIIIICIVAHIIWQLLFFFPCYELHNFFPICKNHVLLSKLRSPCHTFIIFEPIKQVISISLIATVTQDSHYNNQRLIINNLVFYIIIKSHALIINDLLQKCRSQQFNFLL